jgi:hypothetical protein
MVVETPLLATKVRPVREDNSKPPRVSVEALALSLPKRAWRTVAWREGTNKKLRRRQPDDALPQAVTWQQHRCAVRPSQEIREPAVRRRQDPRQPPPGLRHRLRLREAGLPEA